MSLRKLLIAIIALFFVNSFSLAEEQTLREMFQNNKSVIYSLNLRTFNANDKNGNGIIDFTDGESAGSFINAIERLDELKSLGINTIHLLPISPVGKIKALGTAGSLYAMSDFTKLNVQLADTNSELSLKDQAKLFVSECHKRDIKVMVDLPSCGAYDLFINRPDLFILDETGEPYIPADWVDVRLFNVPDNDSLFNSDIFILHKLFVKEMINLGMDGIRADVATIKPHIFWKELIKYAREQKKDFMFLAEASENWTEPASDKAYFTDYKQLMDAGFDGYYGNYFELKNWKTMQDLSKTVKAQQKTLKKFKEKKSLIGSFATHDVVSPLLTGGENFSKIIIWLNATLPLNPYYVDGFLQADDYLYPYANKKSDETFTDDEFLYVHQGQIDIFNYSRRPGTDNKILITEQEKAMNLRAENLDIITKGTFKELKSDNNRIYAYERKSGKQALITIINRNLANSEDVNIKIKGIKKNSKLSFLDNENSKKLVKSVFSAKLKPGEIIIFTIK